MSTVKTSRISTKGQVVIPAELRNELNLEPSDELVMARKGDKLVMRKLHLGDILEDAQEAFEENETVSHEEMKEKYGL
jgi:AbrB family looped-hinge helix DNA binding protein